MNRRHLLASCALALGSLSIFYALFAPQSDEEKVQNTLNELAAAISFSQPIGNPTFYAGHLNGKFKELLTEQVQVRLAEVRGSMPTGRGELGLAAATVLSRFGSLDVSLSGASITVQGDTAEATVLAEVIANQGGTMRTETRSVQFTLVRDGGTFLVQAARVAQPSEEE